MANGAVVYDGPSQLTPTINIVAVLTNLKRKSKNPKTGNMAQLWMLVRDTAPTIAEVSGEDAAVCGNCPLRTILSKTGKKWRKCYVNLFQAVTIVWRTFTRGDYPNTPVDQLALNRPVRLGAFGEPVAIPLHIVQAIDARTKTTGYTHQWATNPDYRPYLMASVESLDEYRAAKAAGWRTFRSIRTVTDPLGPTEIICPASEEAGKRTTCHDCLLCNGARPYTRGGITHPDQRKDIVIVAHGRGKHLF